MDREALKLPAAIPAAIIAVAISGIGVASAVWIIHGTVGSSVPVTVTAPEMGISIVTVSVRSMADPAARQNR